MKKAIGMLAVLAFTASAANAELLKNFKYDGQIEVNAYNTNNMDFDKTTSDAKSFADTRLMLNMGFDLNEDVNAVVSAVKNNRQYGTGSESVTGTGGVLDNVFFEQAYLNLKGVMGIDHKVGRQYYGNAGDMVIYYGPKMQPYESKLPVTAIDGWTGWYKFNGLNRDWDVNAIVAKEKQAPTATAGLEDTNISGVNVKTKISRWDLNAYAYQKSDKASTKIDQLNLAGVRANWECMFVKNLNIGLEYDQDMGFSTSTYNHKHEGYAFKANVDYSMNLKGKLAFAGEYVFQSGDDSQTDTKDKAFQSISSDYRPGIIYGGQWLNGGGFITGSGLNTYNLGVNWTPDMLSKLNLAITYYDFSSDKKLANYDKHLGSEADVVATWTHSASVSVNGYYAMFKPEQNNFPAGENHNTAQMFGTALNVKF